MINEAKNKHTLLSKNTHRDLLKSENVIRVCVCNEWNYNKIPEFQRSSD